MAAMPTPDASGWAELFRTLATTAFGALLGWITARSGERAAARRKEEAERRNAERDALIAMGRHSTELARDMQVKASFIRGDQGDIMRESIVETAEDWWPPLYARFEAFDREWTHSWRYEVGDLRVIIRSTIGAGASITQLYSMREDRTEFLRAFDDLARDAAKLDSAIADAVREYVAGPRAMSKRDEFKWKLRRRFKRRPRPKDDKRTGSVDEGD